MPLISHKYIDDNDFVARYLANRLSDAERESFEAYYLEHPDVLKELNRTAKFKSGLMDLQESGALEKVMEKQASSNRIGAIALAASVVLAIIGGFLLIGDSRTQPILASSNAALGLTMDSASSPIDSYAIQRTRTSSYDATINIPPKPTAIELRVKPEATVVPAKYRVSIFTISDTGTTKELATINSLRPSDGGFVVVYLNVTNLPPAIYELQISGEVDTNASTGVSSFLIELLEATKTSSK